MYQMKIFIDMEHSLCLPVCFCFYQLSLCSVSHTANEYSIYLFCIIIVQDFETVTSMCYFYTSRPSLLFSVELKGCPFQESPIVFSSCTFPQPKSIGLVRGYIEVKISKHDIW